MIEHAQRAIVCYQGMRLNNLKQWLLIGVCVCVNVHWLAENKAHSAWSLFDLLHEFPWSAVTWSCKECMTSLPPFTPSWNFLSFPLSWCQSPLSSSTQSYPDFVIEIAVRHPDPPHSSRNIVSHSGIHSLSFQEYWLLHPSGGCLLGDASPKVTPSACVDAGVKGLGGTAKHGDLS